MGLRQESNCYSPKFCSNVINLLLVLQDLLTVSLKQQGGHTQVVGVKPFELKIKKVYSYVMKNTCSKKLVTVASDHFYLGDVKLLQPVQKGSEN